MLIGRLGRDPELRTTKSGTPVASMSVATSEKYKDKKGEAIEKTEWHRLVAWDRLAELCDKYLGKGDLAYFEGRLQTREWEDKEGNKRFTTEIIVYKVEFLTPKSESGRSDSSGGDEDRDVPEDIPF
jgi:single-strand DNA-binding protein